MRVDASALVAAASLVLAVALWPSRRRGGGDATARDSVWAMHPAVASGSRDAAGPGLWHQDPVEVFHRWRLRRRSSELADDVLDLLRGVAPALEAGLTPSRSLELAATAALGAERVSRARQQLDRSRRRSHRPRTDRTRTSAWGRPRSAGVSAGMSAGVSPGMSPGSSPGGSPDGSSGGPRGAATHDIDRLVGALLTSADRAEAMSLVWAHWAARTGSSELALVAAAWQLSETTGAPLSFAVDRAVRGLLDARARRRKVAVAVAGPRATVTVLTILPLAGPLFGLAAGIAPGDLYLGTPLATACVVVGLGLVWAGRLWCSRMVRRAVRP